jgi:integrase
MKFGVGRERQNIHEIPPGDLEKWVDGQKSWGLSSRRTNMSLFSSLWEVAIAKGWCSYNIVDRLEPVGKISRVVKIYSNDTVLNLLAAALSNEHAQMVIAPLALGLFGCMRPEEVEHEKFGWQYIDLEHSRITVTPEVAKTGDQRTIRLQPAAVEWLKLAKDLKNPLPPVNERRLVDACCERIGLDDWIRDGLRKCCATHLRAVYRNDYDVVKDMGNSVRILLKHYAALDVPEAVSVEHWQLTPEKVKKRLKSDKWKQTVKAAAEKAAAATAAAEALPKLLASGTARRAG